MYNPESKFVVYDQTEWWSDNWDPFTYGRDYDFNKSFFEQYAELQKVVPRMSMNNMKTENSEYCNLCIGNKNSYLVFTADYNEDCSYLRFAIKDYKCLDSDYIDNSVECYECLEIDGCNRCFYLQKGKNCRDIYFGYNLTSCQDCIGCANLVNKKYCIFNEQLSKEDYEARKKEFNFGSYAGTKNLKEKFDEFMKKQIRKYLDTVNCENCLGDHLNDSKNAYLCYDSHNLEDCKYIINGWKIKDSYDWDFVGETGCYGCHEMVSCAYNMVNCHFCAGCWENDSDMFYCELCLGCQNLFGCVGMRHKKYCILNKQYSKEDYEKMVSKIIEHMKTTGEWGEFFPIELAPFAYNETVAMEYFPLDKEGVEKNGYKWYEDESEKAYNGPKYDVPDDIKDIKPEICKQILVCEKTGKPYKITLQELEFLKRVNLPAPRACPKQRHADRMAMRNGFELYERKCTNCGKDLYTSYAPQRPEPVYCEECYLKAIY